MPVKERMHYKFYHHDATYYKVKQQLLWEFYIRFLKEHFTPCGNCQNKINSEFERLFKPARNKDIDIKDSGTRFVELRWYHLCKRCKRQINEKFGIAEVIFGNKDYEPLLELQRKWTTLDDTYARISDKEYQSQKEKDVYL